MFVSGKSQNPRCFRGVPTLPVRYAGNSLAWMPGVLFENWLRDWNRELVRQERKILLMLDKCFAHPRNLNISNIEIAFLPANTTSIVQPCDEWIIQCLKVHYRKRMCLSGFRLSQRQLVQYNLNALRLLAGGSEGKTE